MRRADSKKPSRRGRAGPDKDFLGKLKKQPVLLSAAICSPPAFPFIITTLIISKKPGNTGISRDIRTEFTTDLLLSD